MSGVVLGIIGKRIFDFSKLDVGTAQAYFVEERVDVSQFIECAVLVHVHDATLSGGTINFDIYGDGYSEEEPSLLFRTPSALFASTTLSASGPSFVKYGGTTLGSFVALRVRGFRSSASPVVATISLELSLKNPIDA